MSIVVLHNLDHEFIEDDPGHAARADVVQVAEAVRAALAGLGHDVRTLGVGADVVAFVERLRVFAPDAVVNLCESLNGDARGEIAVAALLDVLGIPFTGSPALALGVSLEKTRAKQVFAGRGIPTPAFALVASEAELDAVALPFPLIVKPAREDASVGIDEQSVVHDAAALRRAVERVLTDHRQPALVERYVHGREIYVPILGGATPRPLPLTEIRFGPSFEGRANILTYDAKWATDSVAFRETQVVACELDAQTHARVVAVATAAFEALGCRDYGRVDLRLGEDGVPYVLEVNPNCDLHPTAGFARAAALAGLDYPSLVAHLVELARSRAGHGRRHAPSPDPVVRPSVAGSAAPPRRHLQGGRGGVRARAGRPRHRPGPSRLPRDRRDSP